MITRNPRHCLVSARWAEPGPGQEKSSFSAQQNSVPNHATTYDSPFNQSLSTFSATSARYSFREYLDAENSLDTILRQGYGAPKAASFLAAGCGRKNLPPNSPGSSMRFAVADSAFDSPLFGGLPSRRGFGRCGLHGQDRSDFRDRFRTSVRERCAVDWLAGKPREICPGSRVLRGIRPALVRAPLGASHAPGGNSLFCFGSAALRVTVSREILFANRREKISPDPP